MSDRVTFLAPSERSPEARAALAPRLELFSEELGVTQGFVLRALERSELTVVTKYDLANEVLRLSSALAVAEGERLRLAKATRGFSGYVEALYRDKEVEQWFKDVVALAERIVAEERTKEGSENG